MSDSSPIPIFTATDYSEYLSAPTVNSHSGDSFDGPTRANIQNGVGFSFSCVLKADIIITISSVTSNAAAQDQIPIKFLKILLPFLMTYILHIYLIFVSAQLHFRVTG